MKTQRRSQILKLEQLFDYEMEHILFFDDQHNIKLVQYTISIISQREIIFIPPSLSSPFQYSGLLRDLIISLFNLIKNNNFRGSLNKR